MKKYKKNKNKKIEAVLAQSVERMALNHVVVGSSPTGGVFLKKLCYVFNI